LSIKALPAIGIYGYYSTGEEWIKVSVDADGKIQITSTDLSTILSEIQSATYGLEAIKDAVDILDGYFDVPTANSTANSTIRDVIGNKTDDPDWFVNQNQGLMGYIKAVCSSGGGISYIGACDSGMTASTTTIVCDDLKGFGDDFFNTDWVMVVALNNNAHGSAPEGNAPRDIQDYDSATGTFTVAAFSANVEEDDKIIIGKRNLYTDDKVAIATSPAANSLAYKLSQFLASGDGDFAGGTPLPSNKSLYDVIALDRLDNATYGLSAIETLVDGVESDTGAILIDTAAMQPKIPRIVCHMDFWSLPLQVTITSTAGDRGLVDVVVSGLPSGVTIIAVQGMFLCDSVENSYDGTNYLESTKIQVKVKTTGTDRDAITLEANKIFRFSDDMIRGGTVLIADWASAVDAGILAEVTTNATYSMWFDVGEAAQNNIVLDGAQFGLRIWYSV